MIRQALITAAAIVLAFGAGLALHESGRAARDARVAVERAERGAKRAAERMARPRRRRELRDGVIVHEEVLPPLVTTTAQEN